MKMTTEEAFVKVLQRHGKMHDEGALETFLLLRPGSCFLTGFKKGKLVYLVPVDTAHLLFYKLTGLCFPGGKPLTRNQAQSE